MKHSEEYRGPDYDTKCWGSNSDDPRVRSTPLLILLPGQLWPGLVVPFRVLFIGQIYLFKKYLYKIGILETIQLFLIDYGFS